MKLNHNNTARWLTVVAYAIAMAWVESAVVFYLRTMIHRVEPYQSEPLPIIGGMGPVELTREAATMVMLLTVGVLAGKNWRERMGYSAIAFGVWDIFYYVFLRMICHWPHSLGDWDILFLLPLPWWGPVWSPVAIALLMVLWGTLTTQFERVNSIRTFRRLWLLNFAGVGLALYVFMADCIRVRNGGVDAIRNMLPKQFEWALFCVALGLMTAPVVHLGWQLFRTSLKENTATRVQETLACEQTPQH